MNKSIIQFNWSEKTNTKLFNLGIRNIEDFEGISIKALHNLKIPKKIIQQIEDICKIHNIKTKETDFSVFRVTYEYEYTKKTPAIKTISNGDSYDVTFIETGLYSTTSNYVATSLDTIIEYIKEECKIRGYVYKHVSFIEQTLLSDACTDIGSHEYKYIGPISVYTDKSKSV